MNGLSLRGGCLEVPCTRSDKRIFLGQLIRKCWHRKAKHFTLAVESPRSEGRRLILRQGGGKLLPQWDLVVWKRSNCEEEEVIMFRSC